MRSSGIGDQSGLRPPNQPPTTKLARDSPWRSALRPCGVARKRHGRRARSLWSLGTRRAAKLGHLGQKRKGGRSSASGFRRSWANQEVLTARSWRARGGVEPHPGAVDVSVSHSSMDSSDVAGMQPAEASSLRRAWPTASGPVPRCVPGSQENSFFKSRR